MRGGDAGGTNLNDDFFKSSFSPTPGTATVWVFGRSF